MLLHDIGKPFKYQEEGNIRHFKGHAKKSKEISKPILERLGLDKEKIEIILKLIEMHSSKINESDITKENVEFYKRLLKIKICDAKGYEKEHSNLILEELNKIKM